MTYKDYIVAILKIVGLAALFVAAPWAWWELIAPRLKEMAATGHYARLCLFVIATLLSFAALLAAPFLANRRLRLWVVSIIAIGFLLDQIVLAIFGNHLTVDLVRLLWLERENATTTLQGYAAPILYALSLASIVWISFALPPPRGGIADRRVAALTIASFVLVASLYLPGKGKNYDFPSPQVVPAQIAMGIFTSSAMQATAREKVAYDEAIAPRFKKIVMIVDESVRGDYLGLNDARWDSTPFLSQNKTLIANYGLAVAATNCSASSRLILRTGLQPSQLPDKNKLAYRKPVLWQYAKAAGYKTVVLDGFRPPGRFHSYMNTVEYHMIDTFDSVVMAPYDKRDALIADKLLALLQSDEPMLIYVNKWGAHVTYASDFPPDLPYEPSGAGFSEITDDRRKALVRDYQKAINWSVDTFFERTLPALHREDTLVVYTSDHGQSMWEGGYPASHCKQSNPHVGEGIVPMWVATKAPEYEAAFKSQAEAAFNQATHFEIFPTLLIGMGYDRDWVTETYGASLLNVPVDRERSFMAGDTFGGGTSAWIKVDLPPRTNDFQAKAD